MKKTATDKRKTAAGKAPGKKSETKIINDLVKDIRKYVETLSQDEKDRFKVKLTAFLNTLAKEAEKL